LIGMKGKALLSMPSKLNLKLCPQFMGQKTLIAIPSPI